MFNEEKSAKCHKGLHLGFEIAKLALKAATVAAMVCLVNEVHRVHKSIEQHNRQQRREHKFLGIGKKQQQ